MRLKLKLFKIRTDKLVAFLNEKDAAKFGLHTGERIVLGTNSHKIIAVVDIAKGFIKKGEIAISEEVLEKLPLKPNDYVDVSLPPTPSSSNILQGIETCKKYTQDDLRKIMRDIVNNSLADSEVAYFVSGVSHCGMSLRETVYLTKAIFETGQKISWGKIKTADKHSIGGIPGNRTTPIIVAICASAGVVMPETSSRAITSAAGTADTVESIAKVDLSIKELKRIVKKTGGCLAWGGSLGLAPADDKLIRVEKLLRLDPKPQLIASILAKKLAAGSKYILIDIPYGEGAKVNHNDAKKLKLTFEEISHMLKLKIKVVLTDGSQPIGNGIGPTLEMNDVIKVLQRNNPPKDLEEKSILLAGMILEMTGRAGKNQGAGKARQLLDSGKAFEKFLEIIKEQKGDINSIKIAPYSYTVISKKPGKVAHIKNHEISYLARIAGCPLDKKSGLYLYKHKHERVAKGEKIMTIYSESKHKLNEAIRFYKKSAPIILS